MSKAIVVKIDDIETFQPPHHMGVISRVLVGPEKGSRNILFRLSESQPGGGDDLHIHPYSEQVCYVLEGEGIGIIDGKEYILSEGTVIFIPPGIPHRFISKTYKRTLLAWSPPPNLEEWKSIEK